MGRPLTNSGCSTRSAGLPWRSAARNHHCQHRSNSIAAASLTLPTVLHSFPFQAWGLQPPIVWSGFSLSALSCHKVRTVSWSYQNWFLHQTTFLNLPVSLFLQLHIPLFMQKFTWSWVSSWKADSKFAVMYRFLFFLNFLPFAHDLISLLSPVLQSILHYHIWTSARRLPQLMEVLGPCLTLPNSQPRDIMNGQVPTFHTLDWYHICKFKFLGLGTY